MQGVAAEHRRQFAARPSRPIALAAHEANDVHPRTRGGACRRQPAGRSMSGHRATRGQRLWIYDGRDLAFVIEQHDDGWRVIDHAKREIVGTFASRELAMAFANARLAAPAA